MSVCVGSVECACEKNYFSSNKRTSFFLNSDCILEIKFGCKYEFKKFFILLPKLNDTQRDSSIELTALHTRYFLAVNSKPLLEEH